MSDIKEKFGISELMTERAYNVRLKPILRNGMAKSSPYDKPDPWSMLEELFDYSDWLHETKLTEAMFQEGGLFEGFKRKHAGYDVEYSNGKQTVSFDGLHCVYCGEKETYPVIQTLADLARLTAKHPLKLR